MDPTLGITGVPLNPDCNWPDAPCAYHELAVNPEDPRFASGFYRWELDGRLIVTSKKKWDAGGQYLITTDEVQQVFEQPPCNGMYDKSKASVA